MHVHQLMLLDLMCHARHVIFVYGGLLSVSTVSATLRILTVLVCNLGRKQNFALLQNNYHKKRDILKSI